MKNDEKCHICCIENLWSNNQCKSLTPKTKLSSPSWWCRGARRGGGCPWRWASSGPCGRGSWGPWACRSCCWGWRFQWSWTSRTRRSPRRCPGLSCRLSVSWISKSLEMSKLRQSNASEKLWKLNLRHGACDTESICNFDFTKSISIIETVPTMLFEHIYSNDNNNIFNFWFEFLGISFFLLRGTLSYCLVLSYKVNVLLICTYLKKIIINDSVHYRLTYICWVLWMRKMLSSSGPNSSASDDQRPI